MKITVEKKSETSLTLNDLSVGEYFSFKSEMQYDPDCRSVYRVVVINFSEADISVSNVQVMDVKSCANYPISEKMGQRQVFRYDAELFLSE
jgi:hypothetical protein